MKTQHNYESVFCLKILGRMRICYNPFNDKQSNDIFHIKKFERTLWELRLKKNPNTWPYRYW
jgi:hypothetical protein